LYLQLHPLLLSTFLESAPIAFPPSHTSNPSNVSEDTPLCLCLATTSLTEVLAKHVFSNASSSTAAIEVRSSVSDFLRRMAPYFPFRPARTASSSTGLSPAFSLSLSYANLGIFLAPRPPLLSFPRGIRRDLGWRGRIKAVEQAWTGMREQARKAQGKGKAGGADGWALEEVADWVIETMVTSTSFSALRLADVKDSPHQQTHWLYPLPQLPTPRSCQSSRSFSSNHHLRPAQLRPIPP